MSELTEAEMPGPSCADCGHLIGVHTHESGCLDSMTEGLLERDNLGFCPCQVSSLTLIDGLTAETEAEVANAFVEWAMQAEIADKINWAWFGEIARRYSPLHEEHSRASEATR